MPCGAKVGNDKASGREEKVGGFNVAVDYVFAVKVGEACEEVVHEGEEFGEAREGEGGGEGEGVIWEGKD